MKREKERDETRRILASELRWTVSIVIVEAITALDVIVYVLHVRCSSIHRSSRENDEILSVIRIKARKQTNRALLIPRGRRN